MTTFQAIALGAMLAYTPSAIILAALLFSAPRIDEMD